LEKDESLIPYFKVYNIGPSLAYNLCASGTTTGGREKILDLLDYKIPLGGRVLLCFGEIDCRYHILKQAKEQNKDVNIIVKDCVKRYFDFIKEVKTKGYEVSIWAVIPTAPDPAPIYSSYPRLGTNAERNVITRKFNEELKNLLAIESIELISIFERLVDSENITKEEFLMDQLHLSQEAMPAAIAELRKSIDDIPQMKLPDRVRLYIGGVGNRKGWKNVNIDQEKDYIDLGFIKSDSIDEIYICKLQMFSHQENILRSLKEICRVLKPCAVLKLSVPHLEVLCGLFGHPDIKPPQQLSVMKLMFGSQTNRTEFNNAGFNEVIFEYYLARSGFSEFRKVAEFNIFKKESCVSAFGANMILNVEAIK
jgi:predicted SAM-dependent methyltransferase